jgi:CRP-like cAMP-binding protein
MLFRPTRLSICSTHLTVVCATDPFAASLLFVNKPSRSIALYVYKRTDHCPGHLLRKSRRKWLPMTDNIARRSPPANRLLAALPAKEFQRLLPELESVSLKFAQIIYQPGDTIRHVYFPDNSIVSLLAAEEHHASLEVGMVGNEGMTGISVFMGVNTSRTLALVQGAGTAFRMKAAVLRREATHVGDFHRLLHRFTHSLLTQMSMAAACNRYHTLDARLARWLLMSQDRVGLREFRLTQEFMSNMLGVRREGVNKVAGDLQREKLIRYSRGQIEILDRAGLEKTSCACYRIIRDDSDRTLTQGPA